MNTQKLFDTYYENIHFISSLVFSNSNFTLQLYGDAFNSSSPHLSRESDCQLACGFPSCRALFVHRHSVVAERESSSSVADENHILKFVCKNVGSALSCDHAVCLCPTSDTRAMLEVDSFGLSAEVLTTGDNDTEQYFLFGESVVGSFPARILFCYSPIIEISESGTSAVVCDQRAVQTALAIVSESWPTAAVSWVTQCHPWISPDVVNIVKLSTVYFVPKFISQCCVATKSQKPFLWKPEFAAAEDVLMKHLSIRIKIAYQLLLQLVVMHRLACCCVSNEFLIKHALFWCLDEMSVADDWNEKPVTAYYMHTLKILHSFLCKRHFPHYFMPDVNILCNCDSSVSDILWMEMEVEVTDPTAIHLEAERIWQTLTCTNSDVTCSIACHLKELFSYSVTMCYIQLFHYLHAGASIDCLIAQHHDMLNHMHGSSSVSREFVKPLIALINSSLGTTYLVKAYTASSDNYRTEYVEKAEHCMLEAVAGNSMHSCILYLVHFLLQMKCYKEAAFYMDMLLANTEFTQFSSIPRKLPTGIENCINGTSAFSDQLSTIWHHASCHADVMFSPVEVSVLFPQLELSLLYAYCNKIGYDDSPVAVLKLEFWAQYIGALCYMHSDVSRALLLLADAERCLDNSMLLAFNVSDRAHITYFNILADAHKQIGEMASALRLYRHSRRLFKHSHNPANWQLFTLGLSRWFTNTPVWLRIGAVLLIFCAIYVWL